MSQKKSPLDLRNISFLHCSTPPNVPCTYSARPSLSEKSSSLSRVSTMGFKIRATWLYCSKTTLVFNNTFHANNGQWHACLVYKHECISHILISKMNNR